MAFTNVDVTSLDNALYDLKNSMYMARVELARYKSSVSGATNWQCLAKDNYANALDKLYEKDEELLNTLSNYHNICGLIKKYQEIQNKIKNNNITISKLSKSDDFYIMKNGKEVPNPRIQNQINNLNRENSAYNNDLSQILKDIDSKI